MTPKSRDFHEFLTFLEIGREAPRKLLGCIGSVVKGLRVSGNDFRVSEKDMKKSKISRKIHFFHEIETKICWARA